MLIIELSARRRTVGWRGATAAAPGRGSIPPRGGGARCRQAKDHGVPAGSSLGREHVPAGFGKRRRDAGHPRCPGRGDVWLLRSWRTNPKPWNSQRCPTIFSCIDAPDVGTRSSIPVQCIPFCRTGTSPSPGFPTAGAGLRLF